MTPIARRIAAAPYRRAAAVLAAALAITPPHVVCAQEVPVDSRIELDPNEPVDPGYAATLDARNEQALEEAREGGGSFAPILTGAPVEDPPPFEEPAEAEAAAGTPVTYGGAPEVQQPAAVDAPDYDAYGVPAAAGVDLAGLIEILVEEWSREPRIVALAYTAATSTPGDATAAPEAASRRGLPASLPAAGSALYGRILYEVNSDIPGPVLVEILEAPLAGAVATGAFERVRDRLAIRLDRMELKGASVPIDGWAVGLDCACFAVEGEVDRHWFDRVLLPAAIAFATGWADALARPETQVHIDGDVVVETTSATAARQHLYEGAAEAARVAGTVLQEDAPQRLTVRIPRDTELAVTFVTAPPATAATRGEGDGDG